MSERIRTERLELVPLDSESARRIGAGDLSGLTAGAGWPHADTFNALAYAERSDSTSSWLVELDGAVIGDLGWKGGPGPDGRAEIGYGLAPAYRRRGYGTEAVVAFAGWASRQPGVRRLVAETLAGNTPSRRVLERAGFTVTSVADGNVYWERECAS